jgi:PAS domain S-box-containing protein
MRSSSPQMSAAQPRRETRHFDPKSALPVIRGFARLHDFVALIDPDGNVAWMSDALASTCGGLRSYLGKPWLETFARPVRGEHLAQALATVGKVSNEPVTLHNHGGDPIEATVSAARIGPEDEAGFVVAIFRADSDTAQRELRHTLGYMAAVLDSAPEGVVVVDRSSFITYANPAITEMTGWPVEELIDKPLVLFLAQNDDIGAATRKLLAPEVDRDGADIDVRRRDGSPFQVNVTVKPLSLNDGSAMGVVAYVRDVTVLRAAQLELERKNAELEHYVNAVSHDLRSPLVALLGFSRLLREDFGHELGDKGQHFLHRIEEAGRTMEALLHDLLELSRIGKTDAHRLPVDPQAVLLQLEAELKPRLEAAGISLQVARDLPILHCDRTQLYQILSNLVGNAITHMGPRPGAHIDVEVTAIEGHRRISVRDNGRGITRSDHQRIFEVFQNLGGKGTGIGLAVVKRIAEAHGGHAWVESEPGEGATFYATLANP